MEVEEGRFWSFGEIRAGLGTGVLTPNFEHEFGLIERAVADAARARAQPAATAATTSTGSSASPSGDAPEGAAAAGR
jgi:hypothetical protein